MFVNLFSDVQHLIHAELCIDLEAVTLPTPMSLDEILINSSLDGSRAATPSEALKTTEDQIGGGPDLLSNY